jgi:hypothetical protein
MSSYISMTRNLAFNPYYRCNSNFPPSGTTFLIYCAKIQSAFSLSHFEKPRQKGQKATFFCVPKSRIRGAILILHNQPFTQFSFWHRPNFRHQKIPFFTPFFPKMRKALSVINSNMIAGACHSCSYSGMRHFYFRPIIPSHNPGGALSEAFGKTSSEGSKSAIFRCSEIPDPFPGQNPH